MRQPTASRSASAVIFRRSLLLSVFALARAPLKLAASFGAGSDFPLDSRFDEDNISPPITWSGAPKNTDSFVLIVESARGAVGDDDGDGDGGGAKPKSKTHWVIYDIPKEVNELREELSGAGATRSSLPL